MKKIVPYRVGNIVRKRRIACKAVKSNFSFSHNVFHSCISLVRKNAATCGNGLKFHKTTIEKRIE